MGETQGETGAQNVPAEAKGAPEQAKPEPVTQASEGTSESGDTGASKAKAAAVAAGTGAALAGVAGGIAVAARDTRRRLLGIPIGRRSRFQRGAGVVADTAGTVVEKVREPVKTVGSRFSRDS